MASLNIVSLPRHIDELRIFMTEQALDILAINETSLDPSISNQEIQISGYEVIRKDKNRNGGGVCLYVRSTINYKLRRSLVPQTIGCLCIEICKPSCRPFLVSTWYRPPSSPAGIFEAFETFIGRIDCENKDSYILGDINCDMLPQESNSQTNTLLGICDVYPYTQIMTQPTRITYNSATLIDLILTNTPQKIIKSGVIRVGFSDHDLA